MKGNIEGTLSFHALPLVHPGRLKSAHMLERLKEQSVRRTRAVPISPPNVACCPQLIRALAAEIHEDGIEARRYLDVNPMREQEKSLPQREEAV